MKEMKSLWKPLPQKTVENSPKAAIAVKPIEIRIEGALLF